MKFGPRRVQAPLREGLYGLRDVDVHDYMCPKIPKYCQLSDRLGSFSGLKFHEQYVRPDQAPLNIVTHQAPWPKALPITPESLAEAGFYYTG